MALDFERIAYLGDSLTDDGNLYDLTRDAFAIGLPLWPPYAGAVTNGQTHAELVPDLLGVSGDLNFAVAGAQAGTDQTLRESLFEGTFFFDLTSLLDVFSTSSAALDTFVDLPGQTERLLDATAGSDRSDMAVSILIGANDLNIPLSGYTEARADAAIDAALDGVAATVLDLKAGEVGTVFLHTLPGGSAFPLVSAQGSQADALGDATSAEFNAGLRAIADTTSGVEIVETGLLIDEVAADPMTFGFRNAESHHYSGTGAAPFPTLDSFVIPNDQFMFWDEVHPTEELHQTVAVFQATAIADGLVTGTAAADALRTGGGTDLILALDGDDTIRSGGGDDRILSGLGDDLIRAGSGLDIVSGGSGADTILGGGSSDLLAGGAGDDLVTGGGGHDVLVDGGGADTMLGGSGDDIFIYTEPAIFGGANGTGDTFDGGDGMDTLVLRVTASTNVSAYFDRLFRGDTDRTLDTLGIDAVNIEDVIFTGPTGFPSDVARPVQADLIAEADLWNFV